MKTIASLTLVIAVLLILVGCEPAQPTTEYPDPFTRPFDRLEIPTEFPAHPRLFMNQPEIDELKAWIERDAELGKYVDNFLAEMREAAQEPMIPGEGVHNHHAAVQANKLALAYVLTDEIEFAEAAAKILVPWIDLFPTYKIAGFKGIATDSTLGEVQWAAAACAAYDFIYNAGVLTDQQKADLEQKVFRVSADVMFDCNHAFRSNWRIAATGGVGVVGFCIGDRDLIDKALHGARDEEGRLIRDGLVNQMTWSMFADGIYYERSASYTNICMLFYGWMLEPARHSGMDLWTWPFTGNEYDLGVDADSQFDNTGPKVFTSYLDALCYRTFGNARIAGVGNDGGGMIQRQYFWATAWRANPNPKYAWLFNRGLDGKIVGDPLELMHRSPDMPAGEFDLSADAKVGLTGQHTNACTLLPNGGFAILRQDGGEDAVGVALTYGQYVNAHSHPDQLSLTLYADGHIMAPDMKDHSYGHEGHIGWAKQTIAHNTVTVDEVSQYPQLDINDVWVGDTKEKPAYGKLVFFHPGEELKAFRGLTDSVYEGVVLDRTIALVDSVVVDFYRCRSGNEHQYDLALHVDGELGMTSVQLGDVEPTPPSEQLGYDKLVDVRRATTSGDQADLVYKVPDNGPTMRVALLPDGPAELITARGYPNKAGHRRNALITRRSGTDVDFINVMAFDAAGDVTVERLADLSAGLLGVKITRANGQIDLIISADEPGTYTVAGQTFTAQLALMQDMNGATVLVDVAE
jgi:oligo-alginate lyase